MKKFVCLIFALLLSHSDKSNPTPKYYCCIIFQDGSCYEEYFYPPYLELVIRDFVADSSIESVFVTRDVYKTNND